MFDHLRRVVAKWNSLSDEAGRNVCTARIQNNPKRTFGLMLRIMCLAPRFWQVISDALWQSVTQKRSFEKSEGLWSGRQDRSSWTVGFICNSRFRQSFNATWCNRKNLEDIWIKCTNVWWSCIINSGLRKTVLISNNIRRTRKVGWIWQFLRLILFLINNCTVVFAAQFTLRIRTLVRRLIFNRILIKSLLENKNQFLILLKQAIIIMIMINNLVLAFSR